MRNLSALLAAVLLLAACLAVANAYSAPDKPLIPPFQKTRPMEKVPRFGKFEAAFTLPDQTGNPFDPTANDIEAVFHGPGHIRQIVPAFWDGICWKVRFAPAATGRYTLGILRDGRVARPIALTTDSFVCTPSNDPGYIHIDPNDPQRFIFSNGRGYYPIGINQAWTARGLPDYPQMFATMHACGLNWARVWMTFWDDKALDWAAKKEDDPTAGRFFLPAARRMDMVMDSAAADGIYIQLVLQHHGQYTAEVDPNWADNPANIANGGYLKEPQDFFTDPKALRLTRAKYRYIVARWGYSTHLFAYELFNEVQNIHEARPIWPRVVAWHKQMAQAIRSIDIAHHMVTTSISDGSLRGIGLDFDQLHIYSNDIAAAVQDIQDANPVFVGEFGPGGGDWGYGSMSLQVLQDGLWSGITTPVAGAPEFWYWDVVQQKGWWPELASAARFYQLSGAADQRGLKALSATISLDKNGPAPVAQWKGNRRFAMFWVRSSSQAAVANAVLLIPSLAPGRYTIHLWSPARGVQIAPPLSLTIRSNRPAQIALPAFTGAIAGYLAPP